MARGLSWERGKARVASEVKVLSAASIPGHGLQWFQVARHFFSPALGRRFSPASG